MKELERKVTEKDGGSVADKDELPARANFEFTNTPRCYRLSGKRCGLRFWMHGFN